MTIAIRRRYDGVCCFYLIENSREVGLSRSALAEHFIRLIGVPPINLVLGCFTA